MQKTVLAFIRFAGEKDRLYHYTCGSAALTIEAAKVINATSDTTIRIKDDEREVDMCRAWKEWWDDAYKEGKNKGKIEGKDEGKTEERLHHLQSIQTLMNKLNLTLDNAMEFLEIPSENRVALKDLWIAQNAAVK